MATRQELYPKIIEHFQYLHGRKPTEFELNHVADAIISGRYTFESWAREAEGQDPEAAVIRIFKEIFGTTPEPAGVKYYADRLRNGQMTRAQIREEMANSPGALLMDRKPGEQDPLAGQKEDAKVYLDNVLRDYGLESLSGWAWEQIQAGHSQERIIQELRNRPEYKARFPGMDQRRAAGLSAISEAEYINYERLARETMRRAGMPPGFWDNPNDYTSLIANDVSIQELESRVNDGWRRVAEAPAEVRAAFAEFYGVEGDTALAAWFVDASKAEPLLLKAAEAARIGGYGTLFGLDLAKTRAEAIVNFGKSSEQVVQALPELAERAALFAETVSEGRDLTAEEEGLNAVLGMDATSANTLQRRGRARYAATSGGGGAIQTNAGIGVGSAE